MKKSIDLSVNQSKMGLNLLKKQLKFVENQLKQIDEELEQLIENDEDVNNIQTIPGIGRRKNTTKVAANFTSDYWQKERLKSWHS